MSASTDTRAFSSLEDMLNAEDGDADTAYDADAIDSDFADGDDAEDEGDAADTDDSDDTDEDEAGDGPDDETDDEADDEEGAGAARRPNRQQLDELREKARRFDAKEFPAEGRLREARTRLQQLEPEVARYQVAAQVQETLSNTLLQKLAEAQNAQVKLYEDAAGAEEDPARKQIFLLQAANLRSQYEAERNGIQSQAQQNMQQLLAQTQQQHQAASLDRNFRDETPDQLRGAIRTLRQKFHLTEQDVTRLTGLTKNAHYQRILREAPLNVAAQATAQLLQDLAAEARKVGQRRAKSNAKQADTAGTFRREKAPQASPRKGGFDESRFKDKGEGGLAAWLNHQDEQADRRARRR